MIPSSATLSVLISNGLRDELAADGVVDPSTVTIITGNPHDINLLVGLTRRSTVAVDAVS